MKDKNSINQEIEKLLQEHAGFASEQEAFDFAEQFVNQRNAQSDPALGGLSPDQVFPLVNLPWGASGHPMQLNEGLSPKILSPIRFLKNAHLFLADLMAETQPNATARGNLNRRFVGQIIERLELDPGLLDQIKRLNKAMNETDVRLLHVLRLVCEVAGLIRLRNKSFHVVKKYQPLLQDAQAGKLYAVLFEAYFTKFNLSYCDIFGECSSVQSCIPYTLAQLARRADQWQDLSVLSHDLLLPVGHKEIAESIHSEYLDELGFIEHRLLVHLETFGLLECKREHKDTYKSRITQVRKTKLFDQFISFDW